MSAFGFCSRSVCKQKTNSYGSLKSHLVDVDFPTNGNTATIAVPQPKGPILNGHRVHCIASWIVIKEMVYSAENLEFILWIHKRVIMSTNK